MLGSRRMGFIGAALVVGLTACGSTPDTTSTGDTSPAASPPVIHIAGSPAGESASGRSAAPMAAEDAAADSKMMPAQITYVYDGELIDLTAPAAAWFFDPTASPTTEQIAALAQALGVEGDVREQSADMGGGWMVGPDNYEQPTLSVGSDAMQSWWYSPGNTAAVSPKCELYPPGDPAGDFDDTPVIAPDEGATVDVAAEPAVAMPVCEEPAPPANVPDEATAEAQARDLFETLGFSPDSYEFETYADEWGANATGYLVLDGIRTSMTVNVGFGAEGALTWASGFLATPQRGADYPRIGIEAAVQRLNDQSASWMALDTAVTRDAGAGSSASGAGVAGVETAPAAVDAPAVEASEAEAPAAGVVEPLPASLPEPLVDPVEGVCPDDAATDCAPAEPITVDPITVTLTNPRPSLEQLWASDDTVWLLPGYAFDAADGGVYSVMAVEDQYIEVAPATEVPVPDTAPSAEPGSEPVPPADCPARPTEITEPGLGEAIAGTIVGLCEADAAAMVTEIYPDATMRVVRIDGVDQAVTADFNENRVNVAVDQGIVTEVVSIG